MPSFSDSIFLFVLALLLFGPKRLPVLARELGKWVGEFRRASNEFKMQMEEELRLVEQADRQKQIAAIEAAAPIPPSLEQPKHPDLSAPESSGDSNPELSQDSSPETTGVPGEPADAGGTPSAAATQPLPETNVPVLPIATSGELRLMPPSTGLPKPQRSASHSAADPLGGLLESIPEVVQGPEIVEIPETSNPTEAGDPIQETAAHGH